MLKVMMMVLSRSSFLIVIPLCIVSLYAIAVYAQRTTPQPRSYPQDEIDEAWNRMVKREVYLKKWANQTGCWLHNIVPFYISRGGFTQDQIDHIFKDILQIQNRTCIRWVERDNITSNEKLLVFEPQPNKPKLCDTNEVGSYPSGVYTIIRLGEECFEEESVIHEMLHALGLTHEHQRIDRDCYVEVSHWAENEPQFKVIYDDFSFERWPYDKKSVTHCSRQFFVIKDKEEGFFDLPWDYNLGDTHGIFKKSYGKMTEMDVLKLNYRFCKGPDYCDIQPIKCDEIEEQENRSGCKQLYVDLANGVVLPTNKVSES